MLTGEGSKKGVCEMSEATQVSRRGAFSLLGLTTLAFALPTQVLTSSDVEAQQTTPPAGQQATPPAGQSAAPEHGTKGMKRRKQRRASRKERHKKRRGGGEAPQQQK